MSDTSFLNGKKVLVVDDEPDILEVLEELLEMCDVVTASTFEKAKELLESSDFDIAILDIMGVNGYGLLDIANKRKHSGRYVDGSRLYRRQPGENHKRRCLLLYSQRGTQQYHNLSDRCVDCQEKRG